MPAVQVCPFEGLMAAVQVLLSCWLAARMAQLPAVTDPSHKVALENSWIVPLCDCSLARDQAVIPGYGCYCNKAVACRLRGHRHE